MATAVLPAPRVSNPAPIAPGSTGAPVPPQINLPSGTTFREGFRMAAKGTFARANGAVAGGIAAVGEVDQSIKSGEGVGKGLARGAIVGTTVGLSVWGAAAAGAAIGTAIFPGGGTLAGAGVGIIVFGAMAAGAWLGSKIGTGLSNGIFGERKSAHAETESVSNGASSTEKVVVRPLSNPVAHSPAPLAQNRIARKAAVEGYQASLVKGNEAEAEAVFRKFYPQCTNGRSRESILGTGNGSFVDGIAGPATKALARVIESKKTGKPFDLEKICEECGMPPRKHAA